MTPQEERISEIMNLVGYGLAKFDLAFAKEFGCPTKSAFCRLLVSMGIANTEKAVTNRQDSFDPYFDNDRRGWFQRNQREHIKLFIDSLFGQENVQGFANIVKMYIQENGNGTPLTLSQPSPTAKSKFKQLQETGREAEFYFMNNYHSVPLFQNGMIEDARLWGDGYDFQVQIENRFLLAEVKGVRDKTGAIRLTQNEYDKASEYLNDYILVVVSNLAQTPKLSWFQNPLSSFDFESKSHQTTQLNYYSQQITW